MVDGLDALWSYRSLVGMCGISLQFGRTSTCLPPHLLHSEGPRSLILCARARYFPDDISNRTLLRLCGESV
jgi:hypothetical protein